MVLEEQVTVKKGYRRLPLVMTGLSMYGQITPKDKILPIEEFKKLPLAEMLAELPVLAIPASYPDFNLAFKAKMPRIICADGTTLSVQVGEYMYCSPRDNKGPYSSVEVGFPSVEPPEIWKQYAEDPNRPTDTVYAYVPIELVSFFIAAHGGIDTDRTFTGFAYELR